MRFNYLVLIICLNFKSWNIAVALLSKHADRKNSNIKGLFYFQMTIMIEVKTYACVLFPLPLIKHKKKEGKKTGPSPATDQGKGQRTVPKGFYITDLNTHYSISL